MTERQVPIGPTRLLRVRLKEQEGETRVLVMESERAYRNGPVSKLVGGWLVLRPETAAALGRELVAIGKAALAKGAE